MFGYPKKIFPSPYYFAPRDENPKINVTKSNRFEPYTHVQKEEKMLNTDVELRSATREHVFSFLSLNPFSAAYRTLLLATSYENIFTQYY